MAERQGWERHAIPLALHGDAVPVLGVGKSATRSLDAYSMHGILASGSTLQIKMLLFSVFEQCKAKGDDTMADTMKGAWKLLVWSFEVLFSGYHPKTDHNGNPWPRHSAEHKLAEANAPLADGMFGVIWMLKGDLDHFAKNLNVANYRTNMPCTYCPADRGEDPSMQFTNFNTNAAWKTKLYDAATWKASLTVVHPLFERMPFLNCHNIEPGELHVVHLGTSQYLLGSVLWLLCYRILPTSESINIDRIWSHIVNFYKRNKTTTQISNLTLSIFTDPKTPRSTYARLKTKGAETKHLIAAVLDTWTTLTREVDSEFVIPVRIALEKMHEIQSILDESRFLLFLDLSDAAKISAAADLYLQNYSRAAALADLALLPLFTVAPKHHWFWHWADRSKFLNPRKGNDMLDEDFVGVLKNVCHTCTSSTPLHAVPGALFDKYRWGMGLQD